MACYILIIKYLSEIKISRAFPRREQSVKATDAVRRRLVELVHQDIGTQRVFEPSNFVKKSDA
jgi:hypothetical protein